MHRLNLHTWMLRVKEYSNEEIVYKYYGLHEGKKVFVTIFEVWPLVTGLLGRKYGLLSGGTQGSPAPPHGYPFMTPRLVKRWV